MRRLLVTSLLCALPLPIRHDAAPARPPLEFRLDAGHSSVEFSIGFGFTHVRGRFTQTHGTILYDSIAPGNSSVTVVVETGSIETGWPHRDEHLRTSDFFDVARYPTITFQSERLRRAGDDWVAEGSLTMHGVTRPVAIPFRLTHPLERDPRSRWIMLNATGALRLARKDFGIVGGDTYNSWFDRARAATMGDSVDVTLEIEAYRTDAASQRLPQIDAAVQRVRNEGIDAYVKVLRARHDTTPAAQWDAYFLGPDLVVRALLADGRTADALALSRALAELFPTLASAHLLLGHALAVTGDARGADAAYARAREVFRPPPPDTAKFKQVDGRWYWLDLLARNAIESGRVAEAVPLARTIAEIYPQTANALATYGLALALSGDPRAADVQYARAVALDPMETRALALRRLPR